MAHRVANTAFGLLDEIAPRRTGAALVLEVLRSEGVRYIFGNPGTTELPLLNALHGVQDIAYILGLQEASVVAMADGYAKASGQTGFVNLHTAGGLGHAMGAIIHSQTANTPLVITAGQQDTRHSFMDPLLYGDLVGIARPVVKWAREVAHPEHLPVLLRRAFNDSKAAPSGPVFLGLPTNVLEQETTASAGEASRIERAAVAGGLEDLADACAVVRPGRLAIIAGDEVFTANASLETVQLAEVLGAPVFGSSWPSYLPFPTSHPLWNGSLPTKATDIRARLRDFDAVLALGGHSLITYPYSEGPALPPTCGLLQLSADAHGLGRVYSTTLSCLGDIKASLRVLLPILSRKITPHRAERANTTRHAELKSRAAAEMDAAAITPLAAAYEVTRAIGSRAAIVDESPVTMEYVRSALRTVSSRQYFFMRSAILGWGMPAAVGVSLGLDREPVVSLVGDGSSLYSPQALWTAAREQLPVTFVVMNNREYNILKNYMRAQERYASASAGRFIGMDLTEPAIDFLALATSMGVPAMRVERASEIAGAVENGVASGLPNLIEVRIGAAATTH